VGALVGIIVTEAGRHGLTIDGGEASNLTMVLMFLAGLFAPGDAPDPAPRMPALPTIDRPFAEAIALNKPKATI
jgi:hypothetical protein